jgi:hypothetical protein
MTVGGPVPGFGADVPVLVQYRVDPDSAPQAFGMMHLTLRVYSPFLLQVVDPDSGRTRGDFRRHPVDALPTATTAGATGATAAAAAGASSESGAGFHAGNGHSAGADPYQHQHHQSQQQPRVRSLRQPVAALAAPLQQWLGNGHWYGVGLLLLQPQPQSPPEGTPAGSSSGRSSPPRLYQSPAATATATFVDAAAAAHGLGGYVATVSSEAENSFVYRLSLEAAQRHDRGRDRECSGGDDGGGNSGGSPGGDVGGRAAGAVGSAASQTSVPGGGVSLASAGGAGVGAADAGDGDILAATGSVWTLNDAGYCIGPWLGLQRQVQQEQQHRGRRRRGFWRSGADAGGVGVDVANDDDASEWVWATRDEPVAWRHWGDGQPSNSGGGEDCVVLMGRRTASPAWGDFSCELSVQLCFGCRVKRNVL